MAGLGKKARDKSFTIMVLPHSGERSVSFPLKVSWLKAGAVFLTAVLFTASVFVIRYSWVSRNLARYSAEVKRLQAENSQQKAMINDYQTEAGLVREKLGRLEELDRELREIIGKEAPSLSSRSGTSMANERAVERRIALAEVSRDGVFRREGLFAGLLDEARLREVSLESLKDEVVEVAAYLRAKPSGWPVIGRITSPFGYRRSPTSGSKGTEFHEGIDIAASYGSAIIASGEGNVTFAGYHGGLGQTVVIDHGYGIKTWYGHCSRLEVRQGQKVKRGQVIARVGSSGRSTGPHLHYQVSVNGKCVDPRDYLAVTQQ